MITWFFKQEDVIKHALLPLYEASVEEDDSYYRTASDLDPVQASIELVEMKSFVVQKLIELTNLCRDEDNLLKIISLFEKVTDY